MNSKKNRVYNQVLAFLILIVAIIVSCEKKVYAPGVENQDGTTTSSSTTGGTTSSGTTGGTTSSSTTGGTTGGTTGSTTSNTTGGTTGTSSYVLTVWSNFSGPPISVYVNGTYRGTISSYYTSSPGCNASNCVSVTFNSTGSYSYSADDGVRTWSGNKSISASCNTLNLTL